MPKQHDPHAAFDEAYARLNPAQRQAVDTIDGPVMVIAGPGTGKTQILALRIASILRLTDTAPSSILSLTFTESGVASMRARLVSLIGQEGYKVRVHTFHGFCNEVIRMYPDRFPSVTGRVPLIELDSIRIIKGILDEQRPPLLRPHGAPDLYVGDIIRKLSDVKREHITPDELERRITDERARIESAEDLYHEKGVHKGKLKGEYAKALRNLEKAAAFAAVYRAYEAALVEQGYYDFEDTIIAVIEALRSDEELKLILQEEHQYILADEHQDANGSQNELLTLLADFHEAPNLFIVGDEKQAIYRFQGASLENFFAFKRQYPTAALIPLADNYRSTQRILDAAHDLIAPTDSGEIERTQLAARAGHDEAALTLVVADDEDRECAYIAEKIAAQVRAGVPAGEIAVLMRRNADVGTMATALARRDVPYIAYGEDPVLTHPVIEGFLTLLRAIAHPGDDAVLYPALLLPYSGISSLDAYRLSQPPLYEPGTLCRRLADRNTLEELGVADPDAALAYGTLIDKAARGLKQVPLVQCIEQVLWRSGAMAHALAQPDSFAALDVLRSFFRYVTTLCEAHPDYTLAEVLMAIDEARAYRLSIGGMPAPSERAVSLMTAHRAKGMEFDHVYIPYVHDRRWGGSRGTDMIPLPLFAGDAGGTREDDERRLFYVAMTRARKTLTCSYAERSVDGGVQLPSRFLEEIRSAHFEEVRADADVAPLFVEPAPLAAYPTLSETERQYLRDRLASQGLSVSALNNYLASPWKFFFINWLRIPQARAPHLLYGTAVDEVLKWYTDERAAGNVPAVNAVTDRFVRVLSRLPFARGDFDTYKTRGADALTGYLDTYADTWHADAQSAVRITVPFATGIPELPEIMLRGELDKVELVDAHTVRVVDYKTGKPKTRGEIEGTTKTSNGDLKRQLVFYKLLVDADESHDWKTHDGVLDFVEPGTNGKYRRETFTITDDDVTALTTTITDTLQALYAFSFWESECDPAGWSTDGCALVRALKERRDLFM